MRRPAIRDRPRGTVAWCPDKGPAHACPTLGSNCGRRTHVGSVIKKRRKRMAKKKHRKLLRRTRHQRRNKK